MRDFVSKRKRVKNFTLVMKNYKNRLHSKIAGCNRFPWKGEEGLIGWNVIAKIRV